MALPSARCAGLTKTSVALSPGPLHSVSALSGTNASPRVWLALVAPSRDVGWQRNLAATAAKIKTALGPEQLSARPGVMAAVVSTAISADALARS